MLTYQDWMDIVLEDRQGNPIPDKRYRLHLANGEVRQGQLDRNGRAREENIPPGRSRVVFLD
jgi:type VI secretion system secreted protein VgrG